MIIYVNDGQDFANGQNRNVVIVNKNNNGLTTITM